MTVKYTEDDTKPVFEFEVTGKITQADMDAVLPPLERFIERHGTVRMVEIIPSFDGFEWGTLWDGIKFDVAHIKDVDRVAVVTDIGWMGGLIRAFCKVSPIEVRMFGMDELEAARGWARVP